MRHRLISNILLVSLTSLLAAGCGGGGSSSSTAAPGSGQTPLTPDSGVEAALTPIQDPAQGGSVTAAFSSAVAINDSGEVIGFAETGAASTLRAARWTVDAAGAPTLAPTSLKPLGSETFSAAFAIDEAGNVVGISGEGSKLVAVLWKAGIDEPVKLPVLTAGGFSAAYGISPDGSRIVGEAEDAFFNPRAVLWQVAGDGSVGAPVLLPEALEAPAVTGTFSSANAVGDNGWIVGEVEDGEGTSHAVLWRPDGSGGMNLTDLRRGGEEGSSAYALNAAGEVVGESEVSPGVFVPALWADDGQGEFKRTDLAAAGSAAAINLAGRIAGWSGSTPAATTWKASDLSSAALFSDESQAYGLNSDNLVVGRRGSAGFIKSAP